MKLYHGSTLRIEHPEVAMSRRNLDFGQGFYLTSLPDQAERWAQRKAAFDNARGVVNVYDFAEDSTGFRVLEFLTNDEAWVEFVCACRRGETIYRDYDIIFRGVADDKVYEAVNMYFKGFWDMKTTLSALRFYGRNDQYCFVTQDAVDQLLAFSHSYEVDHGSN